MKNRVGNKILSFALAAVMVFTLLPGVTVYAEGSGDPPLGESSLITAFDPLLEDVAAQGVPLGTSREALSLPETLTATITSGAGLSAETDSAEEATPTDADNQEETPGVTLTITAQIPVTWQSDPEYDGDTAGTYVFTAAIPGEYTVEDGVTPPVITVTVEESGEAAQTVDITIAEDENDSRLLYLPEGTAITDADLLAGVSGLDENGSPVEVTIQDADGLDMDNPQMRGTYPNPPYVITYAAEHPVTEEVFTATREVYVTLGIGAIMPLASEPTNYIFDVSEGMVTIEAGTNANTLKVTYGASPQTTTADFSNTQQITINGTWGGTISANESVITVKDGVTANITLEDVEIDVNGTNNACAFAITGGANVNLNLSGDNILKSGRYKAGLQVQSGNTLTISGTDEDSLNATGGSWGAGIGGGSNGDGGNITISGGTVNASCINAPNDGGAGIGGGSDGSGGDITISGGTVISMGGSGGGAGIGGGSGGSGGDITISGGTVISMGGSGGAGIGGGGSGSGIGGSGGTIDISGGMVNATGGYNGKDIGPGSSGADGTITITGGSVNPTRGATYVSPQPTDGSSTSVYLNTLTVGSPAVVADTAITAASVDGVSGYGFNDVVTDTSGKVYFWLPDNSAITASVEVTANSSSYSNFYARSTANTNAATLVELITSASIAYGNIVITQYSGYYEVAIDGTTLGSYYYSTPFTISGSSHVNAVTVTTDSGYNSGSDPAVGITLTDVNIDFTTATTNICAFEIKDGANVNLTLSGTNILISGANKAGLQVQTGNTLTISGTDEDSLNATGGGRGAGIGGGSNGDGGNITIIGGTVNANGGVSGTGNGGAGIGGGFYGAGGNITISGGEVTANGGNGGAGIGGGYASYGGNITISGGTVNATGGTNGKDIGPGDFGYNGTIKITGGSVNPINSSVSPQPTSDGSTPVYLNTLTVGNPAVVAGTAITACTVSDLSYTYGTNDVYTNASGIVYFWLPPNSAATASVSVVAGSSTYSNAWKRTSTTEIQTLLLDTPPTITTTSLSNAVVNTSYSQTLAATGHPSVTWSIDSGSLPGGLTLNASTGQISGTPTASGTFSFTVKAANGVTPDDTKQLSIVVSPAPVSPTITTITLAGGTVGAVYTQTLAATGDTPITWSLESGSLPGGLTLNASTGEISGTPTAAGTFSFTVKAENGVNPDDTKQLSIVVSPAPVAPTITTTTLTSGTVGAVYSQTLAATGDSPITWSIDSGSLPGGLTLTPSTGQISGTPTASGTFSFTVKAANGVNPDDTKQLSIVVSPAPVSPTITTITLAGGKVGAVYTQTLVATGDTPITWSLESGSLPGGLTLTPSTGQISGTPTASGTFSFTVKAVNGVNPDDTKQLSIVVSPAPVTPTVTTTTLTGGTVGAVYSQTLVATGDTPITWSLYSGSLPGGLTLNASTGEISGTPTAAGTFSFTVKAENGVNPDDTKQLSIVVSPAPVSPTITTITLAGGKVGAVYTQTLVATGDTPITWSLESGSLPGGLTLNASTGEISGTPTAAGTFSFTVKAENDTGDDTQQSGIVIDPETTHTITYHANGAIGVMPAGTAAYGGDYTIAANRFSRTGYTFTGWNTQEDGGGISYTSGAIITNIQTDIVLYVQWRRNSSTSGGGSSTTYYTVSFNTDGGSRVSSQSVAKNGTVTKPADPTREGYAFTGWYTEKELTGEYKFSTKATSALTLYAGWEENTEPKPDEPGETHAAYISGYPDGTFRPDSSMTRAEAATLFYNLLGDTAATGKGFTDVPSGAWYYDAVTALSGAGIISGYPDGTFRPDCTITRAEFITMATRFAGITAQTGASGFPDVSDTHWAAGYIAAAVNAGYISGYPDGTFRPDGLVTRAEAVTVLNKVRDCKGASTGKSFTDTPKSHWAYEAITAAATDHTHE